MRVKNTLRLPLDVYPFTTEVVTRFADIDPQGHINNVAVANFYQESRLVFHRSLDYRPRAEGRTLVAHHEMDYLAELHYPGVVVVGVGVGHIGTTSYTLVSGMFQDGRCAGAASTVIVHGDACGPAILPAGLREQLALLRMPAAAGPGP